MESGPRLTALKFDLQGVRNRLQKLESRAPFQKVNDMLADLHSLLRDAPYDSLRCNRLNILKHNVQECWNEVAPYVTTRAPGSATEVLRHSMLYGKYQGLGWLRGCTKAT